MQAHNVATATTAELLAFFNANTGGAQIKKFADRKTAERRVLALIAEIDAEVYADTPEQSDIEEMRAEVATETPIIEIESEQNPITAELVAEQTVTSPGLRNPGDVFGSALNAAKLSTPTAETPIVDKFIPSYNHTVCPKCGSSEIYNGRADNGIVVDEDEIAGCHACDWVQDDRKAQKPTVSTGKARPAMTESLKLDRRITHVETGTVYENACRVWKAGLVSASQGDRLSSTLYTAAKKGDYVSLTVNGHTFTLTAR